MSEQPTVDDAVFDRRTLVIVSPCRLKGYTKELAKSSKGVVYNRYRVHFLTVNTNPKLDLEVYMLKGELDRVRVFDLLGQDINMTEHYNATTNKSTFILSGVKRTVN